MKNSNQLPTAVNRRARSLQTRTIERNGNIVATIRMLPGEFAVELAPEVLAISGMLAKFRDRMDRITAQVADELIKAEEQAGVRPSQTNGDQGPIIGGT